MHVRCQCEWTIEFWQNNIPRIGTPNCISDLNLSVIFNT